MTKKGIDKKFIVRHDINNKKLWVFEVYYADLINNDKVFRDYPNFISARYENKQSCLDDIKQYKIKGSVGVSWRDQE